MIGRALESMDCAVGSLRIVLEMTKRSAIHHLDRSNRAAIGRTIGRTIGWNAWDPPWLVLGFIQHTL